MASKHVVQHPVAWEMFRVAATRWNALRAAHRRTERMLWLGTMATNFTATELTLLDRAGFLCASDRQLLRQARESSAAVLPRSEEP